MRCTRFVHPLRHQFEKSNLSVPIRRPWAWSTSYMSLDYDESSSSPSSASFLVPQLEGRSLLDGEGKLVGEDLPKDRSNLEFFRMRELGMVGSNRRSLEQRDQYASIPPNQTLYDLPTEFGFAKRFSPCGRVTPHLGHA